MGKFGQTYDEMVGSLRASFDDPCAGNHANRILNF